MAQETKGVKHPDQGLIKPVGNLHLIVRRKNASVQEEIQSVNVIVRRLLEVKTVRANLVDRFLENDAPASLLPSARAGQAGAERPQEK